MDERHYTKNGEWILKDGAHWKVGLSASAARELGDVTFVEPPPVGRRGGAGEAICAIEAVKAAADFYLPVAGTVVAVNPRLSQNPSLVNQSPEDEGWILALGDVDPAECESLLDAQAWALWEAGH